jgi:4-cresol dehydrogenase (hydroxylating) flavoprotein subunit
MPAPEYFQAYYFRCDEAAGVSRIIDALRPLRLDGTIRSASHIANDYKVISALQQYPWEAAGGRTPLEGELLDRMRRDLKIGAWNGSGALYGTRGQVKEARRLLRKALNGVANRLEFLDDRKLELASLFAKPYQWISGWNLEKTLAVLKPVYGLMKGIPTDHPLNSTYWRKRSAPPESMNPDRDGCGLLWCSPVAPSDGRAVRELTELASALVLRHGFEPAISLTMLTERAVACIISLGFDREAAGEDERAMACYRNLVEELERHGYYSYRLSVGMMSAMGEQGAYADFLRAIKRTLDPAGILAPGRYLPETNQASALGEVAGKLER